jgi:hypothetical protein
VKPDGAGGWVHVPTPQHRCILPKLDGHPAGSVWRCGHCGTYYEVRTETVRNETEKLFTKITEQEYLDITGGNS